MKQYLELVWNGKKIRGYENNVSDSVIVMFHGFTGNKTEAGNLFRFLSEYVETAKLSTIRMDWFGHGESDYSFDEIRVPYLQEQSKVVLQYAKEHYKHVYLLGFSMGGAFAMDQVTNDIEKLILLAPAGRMSRLSNDMFEGIEGDIRDLHGLLLHRAFTEGFKTLKQMENASKYQHPILFVQGENDTAVPLKGTKELHSELPGSTLHIVKQADHCFTSHPYHLEVGDAIIEFIKE